MSATKPSLKVTVFSDYICPFCYVGDARLDTLRTNYELEVDWCFFEIHPDNPPQGKPVSELGYPPQRWAQMMENLQRMAAEDGLPLAPRSFTTNSHRAMLLAEAAKGLGDETFNRLHKRLFVAYFAEQKNIGDEAVLREIATECGIEDAMVERAWSEATYERALQDQFRRAAMLGINGVPAYLIGRYLAPGAVPSEVLQQTAAKVTQEQQEEARQ